MLFRSCYEPKPEYKDKEFQNMYKFAFLQILFNNYERKEIKITIQMREHIKDYISSNNIISQWVERNYKLYNSEQKITIKQYIESLNDIEKELEKNL